MPANRRRWWAPISRVIRRWALRSAINLRLGAWAATSATINRRRRVTFRASWSAIRTWINMDLGARRRTMEPYGYRTIFQMDGRPITLATGFGWTRGAGPGWMTRSGALLPFTTAAGPTW